MRRRLSYANVTATLALVFAMSGGALAANHYLINSTKQISPKVLKKLTGKPGAERRRRSERGDWSNRRNWATGPAGAPRQRHGHAKAKEGLQGKATADEWPPKPAAGRCPAGQIAAKYVGKTSAFTLAESDAVPSPLRRGHRRRWSTGRHNGGLHSGLGVLPRWHARIDGCTCLTSPVNSVTRGHNQRNGSRWTPPDECC